MIIPQDVQWVGSGTSARPDHDQTEEERGTTAKANSKEIKARLNRARFSSRDRHQCWQSAWNSAVPRQGVHVAMTLQRRL